MWDRQLIVYHVIQECWDGSGTEWEWRKNLWSEYIREELKEGVLGENHLESGSLWWVSTGAQEIQVAGLSVMRERARTGRDGDTFAIANPGGKFPRGDRKSEIWMDK